MDQSLYQQLSTSINGDYQISTPVTTSESDCSTASQEFNDQAYFYDTNNIQAMYQQMSHTMFDGSAPLERVQSFSPQPSLDHSWPLAQQQPTYFNRTSYQSLPPQDFVSIAKRPSISISVKSFTTLSDDDNDQDLASEPTLSPRDEAAERRKDRRRAQNRAAQRAFRARKEETIKESSVRLDTLQDELARLQTANGSLSETVGSLRTHILQLQQENAILKRARLTMDASTKNGSKYIDSSVTPQNNGTASSTGFDMAVGIMGTVQWQSPGPRQPRAELGSNKAEQKLGAEDTGGGGRRAGAAKLKSEDHGIIANIGDTVMGAASTLL